MKAQRKGICEMSLLGKNIRESFEFLIDKLIQSKRNEEYSHFPHENTLEDLGENTKYMFLLRLAQSYVLLIPFDYQSLVQPFDGAKSSKSKI